MKTTEVDKLIAGLEWESRRGHYTTEGRMDLLNELKAMKQALNIDIVIECQCSEPTSINNGTNNCLCCGKYKYTP